MNFNDYRAIAKTVIKTAGIVDSRMRAQFEALDDEAITIHVDTWATILTGRAWPDEAKQAVIEHYMHSPYTVTPHDIISYCDRQPVWSSREHAQDWIYRVGVQNPYSGAIGAYSGIQEPVIAIPESVSRDGEKAYLIQALTDWVNTNIEYVVSCICAKCYTPWTQGGAQ